MHVGKHVREGEHLGEGRVQCDGKSLELSIGSKQFLDIGGTPTPPVNVKVCNT